MSLTNFLGVLTLAPALFAVVIAVLGIARRPYPRVVLALACAGALIPAISLLLLAPDLGSGVPIAVALFGGIAGSTMSLSAGYRLDTFGLYAAFGLVFLVTPLLVWTAWQSSSIRHTDTDADVDVASPDTAPDVVDASPAEDAGDMPVASLRPRARLLGAPIWGGVALALGIETAGLTLFLSDNLLWLGLSWLVLAALVWGIGEVGSDVSTLDRTGLAVLLAAPVLWVGALLIGAVPAKTVSLGDLMGRGAFSPPQVIFVGIVLAFAGGAYPFSVWVRRRAALITPAGLAALVLVVLPVVLFVGARTYMAAQDSSGLWPQIGRATPPITAGIVLALLGALTVAINSLVSLSVRDARTLLALLATAQVGWGLLALGIGGPVGIAAVVILLATMLFGLGAMVASVYAAGAITSDIEPESVGPRPIGGPVRPVGLAAWCLGATALVGAPLFAGFVSRQLIAAASLRAGGLIIPLTGLAWAGDALLGIALLRMTAPAFSASMKYLLADATDAESVELVADDDGAADAPAAVAAQGRDDVDTQDEAADEDEETDTDTAGSTAIMSRARRSVMSAQLLRDLPGAILALCALAVGVAPQLLLNLGGALAAATLVPAGALDATLTLKTLGYAAGLSQWLPTLAWLGALAFVVLLVVLLPGGSRVVKPIQYALPQPLADEQPATEQAGLADPEDVWSDLKRTFSSGWIQPGASWLLNGIDDNAGEEAGMEDAEDTDDTEDAASAEDVDATEVREVPDAGEVSDAGADAGADSDAADADVDGHAAETEVIPAPVQEESAADEPVAEAETDGSTTADETSTAAPSSATAQTTQTTRAPARAARSARKRGASRAGDTA